MRCPLFVVLFALAACGTTTPASYRQAAAPMPVRPPPAMTPGYSPGTPPSPVYTPNGAGLYDPGQPNPSSGAPRSPNKRVLPASGESGVWAADGASPSGDGGLPIFNVPLPIPADADPSMRTVAGRCSLGMSLAMKDAGKESVLTYSESIRACMAARAYLRCAIYFGQDDVWANVRDFRPSWNPATVRRVVQPHAEALVTKWCGGVTLTTEQDETLTAITERWEWHRKAND